MAKNSNVQIKFYLTPEYRKQIFIDNGVWMDDEMCSVDVNLAELSKEAREVLVKYGFEIHARYGLRLTTMGLNQYSYDSWKYNNIPKTPIEISEMLLIWDKDVDKNREKKQEQYLVKKNNKEQQNKKIEDDILLAPENLSSLYTEQNVAIAKEMLSRHLKKNSAFYKEKNELFENLKTQKQIDKSNNLENKDLISHAIYVDEQEII